MIRSAFKTFTRIQEMQFELAAKARESSCLSLAYREMRPPGWDAPAFCSNLFHASQFSGLRHGSQCKVALARVIYEWKGTAETRRFLGNEVTSSFVKKPTRKPTLQNPIMDRQASPSTPLSWQHAQFMALAGNKYIQELDWMFFIVLCRSHGRMSTYSVCLRVPARCME